MTQSNQHNSRKREITDINGGESDNNQEPLQKRRKIDSKLQKQTNESQQNESLQKQAFTENDKCNKSANINYAYTSWICTQCTLENETIAGKCAVCGIPRDYDNNISSWDDDEQDIDLDDFDGQIRYSLNNKDIEKRSQNIIRNKETQTKVDHTLNGLSYTECWVCVKCQAMNRLLDTHTKYNMLCGFCRRATYTPSTAIIKSFEWDQKAPLHQSTSGGAPHSFAQNQAEALQFYEKKKQRKYNTKHIQNKEGEVLIMGMIHQNNVRTLSSIKVVPQEVIRLTLLFHGDFEYDGWDTFTNKEEFEIDNGLTTCRRTDNNKGLWRNVFGIRTVGSIGKIVQYEWKLRINKMRNKDFEEELMDSVIIGVIESKGIKGNMGSSFTEYNDGWGLVGDGQKVTDGKYEKFNDGYTKNTVITVTLKWINPLKEECQLFFDDKLAYVLHANKLYKLAIAMNSREYALEWLSFLLQ